MSHPSLYQFAKAALLGSFSLAMVAVVNASPVTQAPASPPAALAAPQSSPAARPIKQGQGAPVGKIRERFRIDGLLQQARAAKAKGDWGNAQTGMLDAAEKLRQMGYEHDQVSVLRDMTLEPVAGKPEQAGQYVLAGQRAMAEYYYKKYLGTKPRDPQWLLEALAWANVAGDEALLKQFSARVPDKAHENIDERGRQRAQELKIDDALYLAFEDIRLDKREALGTVLKTWPYPIDQRHSLLGTSLLHTAVWYNKPEVVKTLLEQYKANVNVADNDKDTPLDYAYHLKLDELATYLKAKGGKPNNDYHKRKPAAAKPPAAKSPAAKSPVVPAKQTAPAAKPPAASAKPAAKPAPATAKPAAAPTTP